VGVPTIALGLAMAATFFNAGLYAWPAAGAVGVAAVICGTVLAIHQPKAPAIGTRPAPVASNNKVPTDPDAYDVAGRRG
jgi:hypothetical protein